ncbi:hypothetical protein AeRB84_016788 [Aphanomyces euteiches]|nr:hypothetical protein AeRB84_016788 [Aphanomyces euteiches]
MDGMDPFILSELCAEDDGEQWWLDAEIAEAQQNGRHGGSSLGRTSNKSRDYEGRYNRLKLQYFCENPIYNDSDFRRRFRMSKRLFSRIYNGVLAADPCYFQQRVNCVNKLGIHPLVKIVAALRMLAYATPADALDENFEISETTLFDTLRHFIDAVIACFGEEFMRGPTEEDVERLLKVNAQRGFNCPVYLAGQFKGKEKKPTVVLEACADADLWIWHASFGWPGSLNDINILDRSTFFDRILNCQAPTVSFVVNQHEYNMTYCLADGNKRKLYSATQEACRKDVERAFDMANIMKACIIMHNMIVDDERVEGYDQGYLWDDQSAPAFQVSRPPERQSHQLHRVNNTIETIRRIENCGLYFQLRDGIVEHIWQLHAEAS